MILTDKDTALKAVLAGAVSANQAQFLASYEDWDVNGKLKDMAANDGTTNSTTEVTVVAATSDDTRKRRVKSIELHNADTAAITLTLKTDDGVNERTVWKGVLQTLETLTYEEGGSWQVHSSAGALKNTAALSGGTLARGYGLFGDANGVAAAVDGGAAGGLFISDGNDMVRVALSGDVTMNGSGAVTIAADAVTEAKVADSDGTSGLYIQKQALALYDFATDGGGAPGAITLTDAVTIPDNAIVLCTGYEVITTFTTAGADAGTVKLNLVTDGDLTTAIAVSDGGNPWDQGLFTAHQGNGAFATAPTPRKTTAARLVQVTSAGQAITAGKAVFFLEYWVSS